LFSIITVHDSGIDVGGRGDLGIIQEQKDGAEDRLDALEWGPTLFSPLSGLLILTRSVQDRYADLAIRIDVGMENWAIEFESGWTIWVVVGEGHFGLGD
jgi:hypothetical protein